MLRTLDAATQVQDPMNEDLGSYYFQNKIAVEAFPAAFVF
jgi:hypothetical protein